VTAPVSGIRKEDVLKGFVSRQPKDIKVPADGRNKARRAPLAKGYKRRISEICWQVFIFSHYFERPGKVQTGLVVDLDVVDSPIQGFDEQAMMACKRCGYLTDDKEVGHEGRCLDAIEKRECGLMVPVGGCKERDQGTHINDYAWHGAALGAGPCRSPTGPSPLVRQHGRGPVRAMRAGFRYVPLHRGGL
jgi:hypothetical protein